MQKNCLLKQVKIMKKGKINPLIYLLLKIDQNAGYFVTALFLVGLGINLISDDNYFFWPPYAVNVVNSDVVGTWAIFSGLGLGFIAFCRKKPVIANLIWSISACAFLGFDMVMEFIHGHLSGPMGGHMFGLAWADLAFLLLVFWLIRHSNTHKN